MLLFRLTGLESLAIVDIYLTPATFISKQENEVKYEGKSF